MNSVCISGRLTRDPEQVETAGGTSLARFGVAVEQRYKDSNDEWVSKPHFVDCTVFGKFGELFSSKAGKGDEVTVLGRLDYSEWDKEDGTKGRKLAVVANEIEGEWRYRKPGETRQSVAAAKPAPELPADPDPDTAPPDDEDLPF